MTTRARNKPNLMEDAGRLCTAQHLPDLAYAFEASMIAMLALMHSFIKRLLGECLYELSNDRNRQQYK